MPICGLPQLIAACRVLRRLLMPRHPPCALYSLTFLFGLSSSFEIVNLFPRILSYAWLIVVSLQITALSSRYPAFRT